MFSTLVQFSKLVSDSSDSEGIFSLLAQAVVEKCDVPHVFVFATGDNGDFRVLSSYGKCSENDVRELELDGVCSVAELRSTVLKVCSDRGYNFRAFPLISETALFGVLGILYSESQPPKKEEWTLIEGLTELAAISLNKAYQHQKLQKAFDDLRASQEALVRTEKLRALGQMSASLAHDLKNLLNPLQLYTDHVRDVAGDRDEVLDVAERMDRILTRGLETVERLRDFSRQEPEENEAVPTDLTSIVREAIEISRPRLGNVELILEAGSPPLTLVRPADCITAIVNLIFNSLDALEGKGKITVRTGSSNGGAWAEVIDNGPGIPPEIRTRILEPFFTTKGKLGTGLGVSTVYALTKRHGGHLEIDSDAGHGARFRIWFPPINETL